MRQPLRRSSPRSTAVSALPAVLALMALLLASTPAVARGAQVAAPTLTTATPAVAASSHDALPDLRMALLRDMRLQVTSGGRTLLRFTTIQVNIGVGAFEVRGHRSPGAPYMSTRQRIYVTDGTFRDVPTRAFGFFAGDGHDHWHIARMQRQQLWSKAAPDGPVHRGAKVGFCFFDNADMRPSLPGHPKSPVYVGCGSAGSTRVTFGLSVGWGDVYPWDIAFQEIDVTDLATGDYRVCVTVDPNHLFIQSDASNDQVWTDVHLDLGSGTPAVTTLAQAWGPCRPVPPL
jgi:hypothetical protein